MKILPIRNIQNHQKTSFNARFSKTDIAAVLAEVKGYDADLYPKLYTMLSYVNELSGETAKFVSSECGNFWQVFIDKKSLTGKKFFINRYSALYESTVNHRDTIVKKSDIVRMPENIFEQEWWKNRKKTESDIKEL